MDAAAELKNKQKALIAVPKDGLTGQEFVSAGQFGEGEFETRNKIHRKAEVKNLLARAVLALLAKHLE